MRAKRSLGQNFLTDPNTQRRIVEALDVTSDDTVIEIGPGRGALTRHLAGAVRRLVAIELDDALVEELRAQLGGRGDVEIVHADVLDVEPATLVERLDEAVVVGNIPYNITTPILFHLLEQAPRPRRIVLMVQREVADRILAPAGDRTYGALSVGVRAVADVERLFDVGRGAFRPVPDVDSTVIRITPRRPPPLSADEERALRALTRACFGMRRKQMQKILRSAPGYGLDAADARRALAEAGVEPSARPETLSPERFVALSRVLSRHARQGA